MCDYSLHSVASRAAKVGDQLVVTDFAKTITRGFAAVGEPNVAVCVSPGTELAFENHVQYHHALSPSGKARVNHKVLRDFDKSTQTIRTSIMMRLNSLVARLSWSRTYSPDREQLCCNCQCDH